MTMEMHSTRFDATDPLEQAKLQMKQFNKLQRRMIRRVLPRRNAMRGARAR
jgi:hypothetical protein